MIRCGIGVRIRFGRGGWEDAEFKVYLLPTSGRWGALRRKRRTNGAA